jgi:hypothetical protein
VTIPDYLGSAMVPWELELLELEQTPIFESLRNSYLNRRYELDSPFVKSTFSPTLPHDVLGVGVGLPIVVHDIPTEDGTYFYSDLHDKWIRATIPYGYWVAVRHADLATVRYSGSYLGIWTEPSGWISYDESRWVFDRGAALQLARQNNQTSIWDIAADRAIYLI